MRIILRKLWLSLLVAGISPLASAMSLGEGQIMSHIGEPFSANIAIVGSYGNDAIFHQVRSAECSSSIIGNTANGCELLYEGKLTFMVKQRPDGQYFLQVTADKDSELFYRIIIKSVSASGATAFKAFEFLPEFEGHPDVQPTASNDGVVAFDHALPTDNATKGEVGVALPDGKNSEAESARKAVAQAAPPPAKSGVPGAIKSIADHDRRRVSSVDAQQGAVKPAAKKLAYHQLQITKGDYKDGIDELRRDRDEIEQQIALLEKQITLLKDVIRLKGNIGASSITETGIMMAPVALASTSAPLSVPLPVHSPAKAGNVTGALTWIMLAVVLCLSALLWYMYNRLKTLKSSGSSNNIAPDVVPTPSHDDDRMSLDLTAIVDKPKC